MEKKEKMIRIVKEWVPYVIIIIVVLLVKKYLFTTILVHGASMNDTLKENDVMILDKISYRLKPIQRFDIVVINTGKTKLIKRVIGLPGEHVKYEDNQLYINDEKVEDSYGNGTTYDFDLNYLEYETIPNHYYFVLGDNREDSLDSRSIGLVSKKDIIGHATFILFPFQHFGTVE